ncbi:MAG: carboxypeptidase-like regulatory domain-containing protein, partial [Kofleriaceae bacterium]
MNKRNLWIGAVVIVAVSGARVVKGYRAHEPEPGGSSTSSPSNPAGGTLARMRADVAPIPLESDPSPAGALLLQGLVLGSDDLPAEGAVVSLATTPPRTARTDKGGSFEFDRLVTGPYRLEARGRGAAGGPITVQLDDSSGPVTLHLRPAASVEVAAVDARSHQALAGALVELRGDDVLSAPADRGGKATFEGIRPGKYVVKAS